MTTDRHFALERFPGAGWRVPSQGARRLGARQRGQFAQGVLYTFDASDRVARLFATRLARPPATNDAAPPRARSVTDFLASGEPALQREVTHQRGRRRAPTQRRHSTSTSRPPTAEWLGQPVKLHRQRPSPARTRSTWWASSSRAPQAACLRAAAPGCRRQPAHRPGADCAHFCPPSSTHLRLTQCTWTRRRSSQQCSGHNCR
jgi:hypothetical protein